MQRLADRASLPGVEFIDSIIETHGLDEFEADVRSVQAALPDTD